MCERIPVVVVALALAGLLMPAEVRAQDGDVRTFAILPERVGTDPRDPGLVMALGHPEGLTVDARGNVYAATFDVGFPNYIYVYEPGGRLLTALQTPDDTAPLGMVTDDRYLYVNEALYGSVLRYDLPLTVNSAPRVFNLCGGFNAAFGVGTPGGEFCALNAIDLGPDGRLYISDNGAGPSFTGSEDFRNGRIWVLDPRTGASGVWFDQDTRGELNVAFTSFPEFGANGVAFSHDGAALYVANMSTDIIYQMPVSDCARGCRPAGIRVFAKGNGINGPDNIAFDDTGILWVASGQNDRVVALNSRGQIVAKLGTFEGFTRGGAPMGLLQPSGIIVSGDHVYVGNESSRGLRPTPDLVAESEWDQLRLFTISEIRTWAILFQRDVSFQSTP